MRGGDLLRQREAGSVAPEILERIEATALVMKDVNEHVAIIHDHPLAGGVSIDIGRANAVIIPKFVLDLSGNCLEMRLGGAGAHDEEVREGRDAAEVNGDDILGFFVRGELRDQSGQTFGVNKGLLGKDDFLE